MVNTLIKSHGIVATDWQIKAAADGNLEAIALPADLEILRPEILLKYDENIGVTQEVTIAPNFLDKVQYQVGDRVYLQEPWYDIVRDDEVIGYILKSEEPEWAELFRFANTMPSEAAKFWYEITGVRVLQMKNLTAEESFKLGFRVYSCDDVVLPESKLDKAIYIDQMKLHADAYLYGTTWNDNLHVVILELTAIDAEEAVANGF